ncbi:hypothetical protein GCM10008090_00510 [Arenicella chitinivorans]|uniref:MAPEG family protein n=1 Tax=Arenicella chitinivorans TaxID=1329800 RepID=A0A918VF42_9GAMM|nr:MAPEG family protein [Arenicella chitinivorans]GGZ96200.1 hypothetical protein GCM10008090_00510 [Arenicella chitinivorans]
MTLLICVTILFTLPFILALWSVYYRIQLDGKADLQSPRVQAARLTGRGHRIVAAQNNAWEALILFCTVLIGAQIAKVEIDLLTLPVMLFTASRVAHAIVYVAGWSVIRSTVFFIAMIALVWIFRIAYGAL